MSLASWKREFYRTPAHKVSQKYALKHSLKKWMGLKPSNIKKHNVSLRDICLVDKRGNELGFGDTTCALCQHYQVNDCSDCPLTIVNNGKPCHKTGQPYDVFTNTHRIASMIKLLQKALKLTPRTKRGEITVKYNIEIPEVHKALVKVELPEGATRNQIINAAQELFEENGSDDLEYSHTLEHDEWTVRDEKGNFLEE